ncbi:MAG TPA: cytochrome c biogenesis protein ResB, partial [Candidatus Limnocylindrales bacterium]|nr:cytochrome c biogenesis protein ResB [Candidatus Limnocylindrales bacterium]
MTLRQLPDFAFRSVTDYATEMARLRAMYEPALGPAVVDLFERIGLFHVFRSVPFSIGLVVLLLSVVACTIDRLPRLWRQVRDIRVVQPDPFYDPRLPDRARLSGVAVDAARDVLRRHRFAVLTAEADGAAYLYGDRNRYSKLATLLTHTGLVLFLVAAAVTSRFGFEAGLVVAEGETTTVQPIGTPGLLVVKNHGFEAPGFETGTPLDFTTDLSVYRDGREIARKTIRVNDPLTVAGFTFHQNGFGPAPDLVIRDAAGRPLWTGPVPLTDQAAGFPYGQLAVPGRDVALELLLQRAPDGRGIVLVLPFRVVGRNPDGSPIVDELAPMALARGETQTVPGIDFTVELAGFADYTVLIAKADPGQGLVWLAFLFLISGIIGTFYFPRRRVWLRVAPTGEVAIVGRADRYV